MKDDKMNATAPTQSRGVANQFERKKSATEKHNMPPIVTRRLIIVLAFQMILRPMMDGIETSFGSPSLVSSYKDRLEFNTKVEEHPIIPRADRAPDVLFTAVMLKSTTMEHVKQEEYRNHPTL
mmetsp:Transcript_7121/g.11053  ORF Transcript_7121/g.11053 Transcript_7121/m.11053 type:complete len:123 (+) Transcript_7121:3966-4334(+)